MKKRNRKKGHVYILQSEDGKWLKFGASTNYKTRVRHINYDYKENPFYVVKVFDSVDIYEDEMLIKWALWEQGITSEVFNHPEIPLIELIRIAKSLLNKD